MSVKRTDVQSITPLYIFVYFNHLTSLHWGQTLPDENLDLSNQFSGKNATFKCFFILILWLILLKKFLFYKSCVFVLSTSTVFFFLIYKSSVFSQLDVYVRYLDPSPKITHSLHRSPCIATQSKLYPDKAIKDAPEKCMSTSFTQAEFFKLLSAVSCFHYSFRRLFF